MAKGNWRSRLTISIVELKRPPAEIVPTVKLEASLGVGADVLEADGFVQGDAAVIRQRNSGKRPPIALRGQNAQQHRIQRAADTFAADPVANVDRGFGRP